MVVNKKSRLGRGLDTLISNGVSPEKLAEVASAQGNHDASACGIKELPIRYIIPNENQARRIFDADAIRELAESIAKEGILQPIIVRPTEGSYFAIVAGERRFRAVKFLGQETILARVISANERDCAVISLIENLQRESLNPVEEAVGFSQLSGQYGFTQEQIAQRVGKARATVANSMRLLNLEEEVLHTLESGQITTGHAKILLSIGDSAIRLRLLEKILCGDLNIRQTERQANILKTGRIEAMPSTPRELSESLMKIEKQIAQQLAASVSLQHNSTCGKIIIEYKGEMELLRIIQSMGIE